jgi:hypothetical protein
MSTPYSGHSGGRNRCLLSGLKRTRLASARAAANDPKRTSAVHCRNGFDAGCGPI